jgi:hypothetical protein
LNSVRKLASKAAIAWSWPTSQDAGRSHRTPALIEFQEAAQPVLSSSSGGIGLHADRVVKPYKVNELLPTLDPKHFRTLEPVSVGAREGIETVIALVLFSM